MYQADVSQALSRIGIGPHIYEVIQSQSSVWTIASRIIPGDPLGRGTASLERLAMVFQKMRDQKAETERLPTLTGWLHTRLTGESLSDLPRGRAQAPEKERRHAVAILRDLGAGVSNMLCHGDPSSRNILLGPGGQLFLIDPRGVSGDVCYDVAVAAWKTAADEHASVRATNLARLVGVDAERVQAWLVVAETARV